MGGSPSFFRSAAFRPISPHRSRLWSAGSRADATEADTAFCDGTIGPRQASRDAPTRSPASADPDKFGRRAGLRFAPSPNGLLHLGHAYSALMNERIARALDGVVLLRVENIDLARCTPAFEAAMQEDLAWLGFTWQGPVVRQSERHAVYQNALDRLQAIDLLYPCFCTRGDIARAVENRSGWPKDPDGAPFYPGTCRDLADRVRTDRIAAGQPFTLRLAMAKALVVSGTPLFWREFRETSDSIRIAANPAAWGDVILARKEVAASYHIAVVTDDAEQAVTDVVRGDDLFHATSLHRLLQSLLGLPEPAYHHHALVRDNRGEKLSKSRNARALRDLRRSGESAGAVRERLGFL